MARSSTTFRKGGPNPGVKKGGPAPPGAGHPKGARLSSALLRALNKPAGSIKRPVGNVKPVKIDKITGLKRVVADELAENIILHGLSVSASDSNPAFATMAKLTEGDKLKIENETDLASMSISDLIKIRAALMRGQGGDESE